MRALAKVFLFLASAVWLAASSAAQTATIYYRVTDFQTNNANISQVKAQPWPTNGTYNGAVLHQFFPSFTRANTPSITNGEFWLSNCIAGVVYQTTFTARGGDQTYYVLVPTNTPDGATIGAWTNVVSPTNHTADGMFAFSEKESNGRFLLKLGGTGSNETFVGKLTLPPGGSIGDVWTKTNADGSGTWKTPTGGGSATNAYQSQVSGLGLIITTNLVGFYYTFSLNAALQSWSAFTPTAYSNGLYSVFSVADNLASGTVPDARLAANIARTNNVNGPLRTNAFGIVECFTNNTPAWSVPDGSHAWTTSGQEYSRTNGQWVPINITGTGSGGSGTVTSVALTVPPVLAVSGSPITGSGTLAVTATVNFETNNGPISSGSMLKSSGGNGAAAATAGTDFVAPATTITVAGTANQITSSTSSAQPLSGNVSSTLSLPSTLIAPGTFTVTALETNHGVVIDQWLIQTNNSDHSLLVSNLVYGTTPFTILTNGTALFNGVPLLDASALKASQYAATDGSTNLVSTQNGNQWTNVLHRTNFFATTNIFLPSDGLPWAGVITNGPHVWITPAGNAVGNWSLWIKSNVTIHLPLNIPFVGYSNVVVTNCLLDLQSFFDTNNIVAGESEL